MTKHLDNAFTWRVEYTRLEPGRTYVSNRTVTVVCKRIETAIAEVMSRWPNAVVIKAFRGERWGNDGVIIVNEETVD